MKSLRQFFFLICLWSVAACHESKVVCCDLQPDQLNGQWNLVQVLYGFSSFIQEYPRQTIVWNFNTQNQTVQIHNNSSNPTDRYLFENGIYPYVLTPNTDSQFDCSQTLQVQGINLGCCTIDNGELRLSAIALDGDYVKLVR